MAAKLREAFRVEVSLVEGGSGIFDLEKDGEIIYSKHATGRFPNEEQLIEEMRLDYPIG